MQIAFGIAIGVVVGNVVGAWWRGVLWRDRDTNAYGWLMRTGIAEDGGPLIVVKFANDAGDTWTHTAGHQLDMLNAIAERKPALIDNKYKALCVGADLGNIGSTAYEEALARGWKRQPIQVEVHDER